MGLVQLVYVSSAAKLLDDAELDQILESSARNNEKVGITGMLLYAAGSFMQVLEGEEESVNSTFARVTADPRHSGVILIMKEAIETREFAEWAMGFKRLTAADVKKHPEHAHLLSGKFDAKALETDGSALSLMKSFISSNNV